MALGSAYLGADQQSEAIKTFSVIPSGSTAYQSAQWYLALAYLKDNQVDEAKTILEALAKQGERTYPRKAKELLKAF